MGDAAIDAVAPYALGFSQKVDFATGQRTISVAQADVNGDSKPDLVVACDGGVSVILNTTATGATTPSFSTKVVVATVSGYSLIGDLNGDAKPDVAVASGGDTVSVLLNTTAPSSTTPTFAPNVDFATGGMFGDPAGAMAIGDFNGDGKPDLAVPNYAAGPVSVFLNTTVTGATIPSFSAKVDFPTGGGSKSVGIADFNGDGKPDLAATVLGGGISILLNTTATGATVPSFATKVDFVSSPGSGPQSVASGDFNDDHKPDLAIAAGASSGVSVLLNSTAIGATTPSFSPKVDFATAAASVFTAIGDLNGDGKLDVAAADLTNFASNPVSGTVSVLVNTTATGAGVPSFGTKVSFATGLSPNYVAIGDLNGDGKPDLAVANLGSDSVSVLLAR